MAPPNESKNPVFLKNPLDSAETMKLGTSREDPKLLPKKEIKKTPSKLVVEILKLKEHDEIEKKAIEINKNLALEWNKGANRNIPLIDELLDAAKVIISFSN